MGTAVLSEIDQSKQNIFSRNIYAYVVDTMGGGRPGSHDYLGVGIGLGVYTR